MSGRRKIIALITENNSLKELRHVVMMDNHRLESERDEAVTRADIAAQAIDAVTAERDEARAWARRMKRERDQYRERCVELEARLDIGTGNLADIEPPHMVYLYD